MASSCLYSQSPIVFKNKNESINPIPHLRYYEDAQHEKNLQDILNLAPQDFQTPTSKSLNFGYNNSKFWLDFQIENQTKERLFLLQQNKLIHHLTVYVIDTAGQQTIIRSGNMRPHKTRSLKTEAFSFDLGFAPKRVIIETATLTDFYLKMNIQTPQTLVNEVHDSLLLNGIILGIYLALFLYNLFVFINLKDESYFWYLLYILFAIIILLRLRGIGFSTFWSDYPALNGGSGTPLALLLIAKTLFSITFLEVKRFSTIAYRFLQANILMTLIALVIISIGHYTVSNKILSLQVSILGISLTFISGYIAFKGYKPAIIYFFAFLISNTTSVATSLFQNGYLPVSFITIYASSFGSVIKNILMANALAVKMNEYKIQALQKTKENEKLIKEQNEILEKEVAKQTQQLQEQNEALQTTNDTKDRLFAIIGHDIRKPVIAFRGIAKKVRYLLDKKDYERLDLMGASIENNAFALHKLTDNLLNWALMQKGFLPYNPKEIKLVEMVEEVEDVFNSVVKEKELDWNATVSDDLSVYADHNAVFTIFRNLVDNAIKYTHKGGKIAFKAAKHPQGIKITVSDNGIGMPPEKVDQLFGFQKVKSEKGTSGEKGTGLGMHLVHELTKLNHGRIQVESQLNVGTTFEVILPAQEVV